MSHRQSALTARELTAAVTEERGRLAIGLAFVAGSVDAVGYLVLSHLFTAHLSGNSAAAGAYTGQKEWALAFKRFFPIPVFIVGVLIGAAVTEAGNRRRARSPMAPVLLLEIALLVPFLAWGQAVLHGGIIPPRPPWRYFLLAAMPALAMGLQNATLKRVANLTVRTTFVTGNLVNLADETVTLLFWMWDRLRRRSATRLRRTLLVSGRQPAALRMRVLFWVWFAFAVGACVSSFADLRWGLWSFLIPLAGLAVIFAIDWRSPADRYTPRPETQSCEMPNPNDSA